jgi:hypothetical protein
MSFVKLEFVNKCARVIQCFLQCIKFKTLRVVSLHCV